MQKTKVEPSCDTCWKKDICPRAEPGTGAFCTCWKSKQSEPKGQDPNDAWRRGEDKED